MSPAVRLIALPAPAPFELWHVALHDVPAPPRLATLSSQEHARAARFVFERDRRRYLAAHAGLRELLAARTGVSPQALVFEEGPFGKPALTLPARCAFNMSHSEDVALVALADADVGEIGVDVEMLRDMPDATALARQNFSASENDELSATASDDQALAFLLGWTRKEACLKAIGSGLSIAPNIFTAGLDMGARSVTIDTPDVSATVWVQSFRHGADVVGSLARIESLRR
jgi:4'-phosphopantetheinyl transferase